MRSVGAIATVACTMLFACNGESSAPLVEDPEPPLALAPAIVQGALPAGGSATTLIPVEITAYCLNGRTATGGFTRAGIVAADKSLFPLGSYVELFVDGKYKGRYLVDDTGPSIRGNRVDLWVSDCDHARTFGRRTGAAAKSLPR